MGEQQEEWGMTDNLRPESGSFLVDLQRGEDWKGGSKVKKVSLYVNLEGVTVTKMQTKKKDPRVGAWDWYHIKSWDVAPNHFAFKIVAAKDAAAVNYRFNTKQAKLIAAKFKEQVNAIMARKRKQKQTEGGVTSLDGTAGPDWDPDAVPVLVTRTKTMKVAVTFQSNGMLAPPPKSSLARGNQGAKGAAVAAAQSHQMVEVLETDNPMADLLKLLGGSQPPSGPAVVPTASAAMPAGITSASSTVAAPPAPPMSNPPPMSGDFDVLVDNVSGGGDLFAAPAPAPASLFDMLEMPVASGHAATNTNTLAAPVMQPIVSTAAQQRSLQEIQAAQNAARSQLHRTSSNPFGSNPQPQPQWGRSI